MKHRGSSFFFPRIGRTQGRASPPKRSRHFNARCSQARNNSSWPKLYTRSARGVKRPWCRFLSGTMGKSLPGKGGVAHRGHAARTSTREWAGAPGLPAEYGTGGYRFGADAPPGGRGSRGSGGARRALPTARSPVRPCRSGLLIPRRHADPRRAGRTRSRYAKTPGAAAAEDGHAPPPNA